MTYSAAARSPTVVSASPVLVVSIRMSSLVSSTASSWARFICSVTGPSYHSPAR